MSEKNQEKLVLLNESFTIQRKIGSGGGGIVYLAWHNRLNKKVVIKADKRSSKYTSEKLRMEADVLKNLHHKRIPQVYDYFFEDGISYTVIDYIDGQSLDKYLKEHGKATVQDGVKWALQILSALDYLHSPIHGDEKKGFIHADIKPANIVVDQGGNAHLIDFNISLALGYDQTIGCTIGYASPEHYGKSYTQMPDGTYTVTTSEGSRDREEDTITGICRNQWGETITVLQKTGSKTIAGSIQPDVRSDIYSLGASLYHLLSGKRPAGDALDVEQLSENEDILPLLVSIIGKAMSPDPELRYQSASEMAEDLSSLHIHDPQYCRLTRRCKHLRIMMCVILISALFLFGLGLFGNSKEEESIRLAEEALKELEEGDVGSAQQLSAEALKTSHIPLNAPAQPEVIRSVINSYQLLGHPNGPQSGGIIHLEEKPVRISLSEDGSKLAALVKNQWILFDTNTQTELKRLQTDSNRVNDLVFLSDGSLVYNSDQGIVRLNQQLNEVWKSVSGEQLAVSNNGDWIACHTDDLIQILDAVTGEQKTQIPLRSRVLRGRRENLIANPKKVFLVTDDGERVVASTQDGSLSLYQTGEDPWEIISPGNFDSFEGVLFGNDLALCAYSTSSDDAFVLLNLDSGEQLAGFSKQGLRSLSKGNGKVYLIYENSMDEFDLNDMQLKHQGTFQDKSISRALFDGNYLMTVSQNSIDFFNRHNRLLCSTSAKITTPLCVSGGGITAVGSLDDQDIRLFGEKSNEKFLISFDSELDYSECRVLGNAEGLLLYNYRLITQVGPDGSILKQVELPDPDSVYDQQILRDEGRERLRITYLDGHTLEYDPQNKILSEGLEETVNQEASEVLETENYYVETDLYGSNEFFDRKSGIPVGKLSVDGYLAYVYEESDVLIGYIYGSNQSRTGIILDKQLNILADLTDLCDVKEGRMYFCDSAGTVREELIPDMKSLKQMAENEV